jgi:hypothetical protein
VPRVDRGQGERHLQVRSQDDLPSAVAGSIRNTILKPVRLEGRP